MKHLKFLAAVCCMAAVFAACEKNDPSDNTNNNGTNTDQNDGNSNTGSDNATGTANGHEWVDLGLSVKWATCNVGASKPEEYGNYYAWGETSPKTTYDWNTYKWATAVTWNEEAGLYLPTLTKYNTDSECGTNCGTIDNKTVLELADDAAHANWGGAWRMPTDAEWTELRENCTWTWTIKNGVNGYEVKSEANGNSIFLPAAGYRLDDGLRSARGSGNYWSSSLSADNPLYAWSVYFNSGDVGRYGDYRYYGQSVRPVL